MFFWTDMPILLFLWTVVMLVEVLFQSLSAWGAIGLAVTLGALFLLVSLMRRNHRRPPADDPRLAGRLAVICKGLDRSELEVAIVQAASPLLNVQKGRVEASPKLGELMNDAELRAMLVQGLTQGRNLRSYLAWDFGPAVLILLAGIALSVVTGDPYASLLFPLAHVAVLAMGRAERHHMWVSEPEARRFVAAGGDPVALGGALVKLFEQGGPLFSGVAPLFRARLLACLALKPELQRRLEPSLAVLARAVPKEANIVAKVLLSASAGAMALVLLLRIL